MDYFISVTNAVGQQTAVITGDQPVYELLLNIKKKYPEKYANIIVRLGGFHLCLNYMGAIGFLMKGSGIEEILSESGVCKKGTAEKVLNGKDYYKMLRCYSLLTEAIFGLLWIEFEQYVEDESIYIYKIK